MAPDTKETIVKAYLTLLEEKKLDKISVTDLVEACDISRQTFYYHFDGIDAMLDWAFKTETKKALEDAEGLRSWCDALYCLIPMLEKFNKLIICAKDSSKLFYIQKLMSFYFYDFTREYYYSIYGKDFKATETQKFLVKYSSAAITGLIYMEMEYDESFSYQKIFEQFKCLFTNQKQ